MGLKHLVMAGAMLAGLAGSAAAAAAADAVTLTFWHNHPEWKERVQKILDKFEAANPGIHIQLEEIPGPDYTARMNTALAAGEAPDIIELRPGPELRAAAESDYVIDLTGKVDTSSLTGAGVDEAQADGKVYGVPVLGAYTVGLYYNRDIFAANGIKPPKPPRTRLQLCKDC